MKTRALLHYDQVRGWVRRRRSPGWKSGRDWMLDEDGEPDERRVARRSHHERRRADRIKRRAFVVWQVASIAIFVWMAFSVQDALDTNNRQNDQIADQQLQFNRGRVKNSKATCYPLLRNNRAIRNIILAGAKQSVIFEPLYKQFGAPPYALRLRQAAAQAAKFPPPDCHGVLMRIKRNIGGSE